MKKEVAALVLFVSILGVALAYTSYHVVFNPRTTDTQSSSGDWFLHTSTGNVIHFNDTEGGAYFLTIQHVGEDFEIQNFNLKILYDKDGTENQFVTKRVTCNADTDFSNQGFQTVYVTPTKISTGNASIQLKFDCSDAFTGSRVNNISIKLSEEYVSLYKKIIGDSPATIEVLELDSSVYQKTVTAKVDFNFSATENLPDGYSLFISKNKTAGTNAPEEVSSFVSSDWKSNVDVLYFNGTNVVKGTVTGKMATQQEKAALEAKGIGKYVVLAATPDKSKVFAGAVIEVTDAPPVTSGCSNCEFLITCLACVDKDKLVNSLFE